MRTVEFSLLGTMRKRQVVISNSQSLSNTPFFDELDAPDIALNTSRRAQIGLFTLPASGLVTLGKVQHKIKWLRAKEEEGVTVDFCVSGDIVTQSRGP